MVPLLAATVKQGGAGALSAPRRRVAAVRAALGPSLVVVTPGVRPTWAEKGDHAASRVQTPADAMRNGSDYLVIGRPITAHKSPSPPSTSSSPNFLPNKPFNS
jgi:orotidine-5'-phosphate decarboxylase